MIRKYTSQVNKDMTTLQDKYTETLQERDYYMSTLRDVKNSYNTEITRLKKDNDKLLTDLNTTQREYEIMDKEYTENKSELRGLNFEYDVLQVDYQDLKEKCNEFQNQLRDVRRKFRIAQADITENDKFSTKRMNRLVERNELVETDKKILTDQLHYYETDLEKIELLCFLCRAGVKTVKCTKCKEMFCKSCYKNVERCPFCRREPLSVQMMPKIHSNSNMDINTVDFNVRTHRSTSQIPELLAEGEEEESESESEEEVESEEEEEIPEDIEIEEFDPNGYTELQLEDATELI
jgi:uncharacterized protein YlxP (DUF503 family)